MGCSGDTTVFSTGFTSVVLGSDVTVPCRDSSDARGLAGVSNFCVFITSLSQPGRKSLALFSARSAGAFRDRNVLLIPCGQRMWTECRPGGRQHCEATSTPIGAGASSAGVVIAIMRRTDSRYSVFCTSEAAGEPRSPQPPDHSPISSVRRFGTRPGTPELSGPGAIPTTHHRGCPAWHRASPSLSPPPPAAS